MAPVRSGPAFPAFAANSRFQRVCHGRIEDQRRRTSSRPSPRPSPWSARGSSSPRRRSKWALIAARTMTGFATSVIACGAEAGIERTLSRRRDAGRPARRGRAAVRHGQPTSCRRQLRNRVGQCVLTSPGSACFAGLEGEKKLKLGASLRFFGDGWQMSKLIGGRRFWRIPVMDGEFVCEADDRPDQEGGRRRQSAGARQARTRRARGLRARGQGDRRGRRT